MKALLLLLLTALAVGSTTAAEPAPAAPSPYAPLAFVVGGTWRGALPPAPDGTKIGVELKADWAANQQGIRFDSTVIFGDQRSAYTSGIYCWHPAQKQLVFLYTDSDGGLTEGTVTIDHGALVHEFKVTEKDGTTQKARAILTQLGPNAYGNEILVLGKDGKWEKKASVRYERAAP